MKLKLKLFGFIIRFEFVKNLTERVWTRGVLNRTKDGKYCCFIDYDKMKQEYLTGEIEHLQKIHNLGDVLLFKSSDKGFHAVCFDKMRAMDYIAMLQDSSCDGLFKIVPMHKTYRNWVLRNFSKGETGRPELVAHFKRPKPLNTSAPIRKQSYAHFKWFKSLYPDLPIKKLNNSDGLTELTFIDYVTASNIKNKEEKK